VLEEASGGKVLTMSGVSGTGLPEVLRALRQRIDAGRLRTRREERGGGPVETLTPTRPPALAEARRLVVKIGSALLVDRETGALRSDWLASMVADVARIKARGTDVILVSSGSIALGRGVLGLGQGPLSLDEAQAAAAVGQIRLARAYEEALAPTGSPPRRYC
jgi:hypothetical protein